MNRPLRVTFCIANLRMGGQVSNLNSLAVLLRARGVEVRFALPEGVTEPTKAALDAFGKTPLVHRLRALWRMLRSLPDGDGDVVHLVLPTPSFTPLCWLAPTSRHRVLVHSEGQPTAFDREHWQCFRDDPWYFLPRLFLNHRFLVTAARHLGVAQLVAPRPYAEWLRRMGFDEVVCVANIAQFSLEDAAALPADLEAFLSGTRMALAYIGHAHPVKGIHDLLEAFAEAALLRPELSLVLALSSDGDAGKVRAHMAQLPADLRDRIHLTGLVPVATLLGRLDALVLPYRSLATTTLYPSLLLEADLAGCPVILSTLDTLSEIAPTPTERLHLMEPGNPASLATVLLQIPKRQDISTLGPALRLPDASERVDQLLTAYQRLRKGSF